MRASLRARVCGFVILLGCSLLAHGSPPGPPENPPIRIGLVRSIGRPTELAVRAPGGSRWTDPFDSALGDAAGEWKVAAAQGQVIIRDPAGRERLRGAVVRLAGPPGESAEPIALRHGAAARRFRGEIELSAPTGGARPALQVVNSLPIEIYLRGVLPKEMPPTAPAEALKAQAVAARTFAWKGLGRYEARGYDLSDDLDSQVYAGADAETAATDAAVRETAGIVLFRDGELILADYYDDCGGITSPGYRPGDYPPSVRDSAAPGEPDFCARGPYHTWTLRLEGQELAARLDPLARDRLGTLETLQVVSVDSSGRAEEVEIRGKKGTYRLKGSRLRALVGYGRLRSTLFTVESRAGLFELTGRGNGHGHGMCQWGAIGQASPPHNRSFIQILQHYFPGALVRSMDQAAFTSSRRRAGSS